MPKISPLGQKLWPTGRGQTDTHTNTQTEKANTEDPFFSKKIFFHFWFSFKGAVRFWAAQFWCGGGPILMQHHVLHYIQWVCALFFRNAFLYLIFLVVYCVKTVWDNQILFSAWKLYTFDILESVLIFKIRR